MYFKFNVNLISLKFPRGVQNLPAKRKTNLKTDLKSMSAIFSEYMCMEDFFPIPKHIQNWNAYKKVKQ